ncbi:Ig-like domain-containing protein, partial [Flavobacterium enshiense]
MKKKYLLILFGFLSFLVKAQVVTDPTVIQVNAVTPTAMCNPGQSVTLSCNYSQVKQPTGYAVSSIPFGTVIPPTITTDLTTDDYWSGVIDLKGADAQDFNFCFYGNSYSKCLVSTNGVITFSINGVVPGGMYTPGANCGYMMTGTIPHTPTDDRDLPYANAIHGVSQDIYPGISNSFAHPKISYFTIGTYPNRMFVLNISEVAQYGFSCRNDAAVGAQSSQIVLYESTNIIDVNVTRRVPCLSWRNGEGVLGIQNSNGTVGAFPIGRNTGAWSANNESWRFTPTGTLVNPVIQWKDNLGNIVDTGQTITVTPNATTTYTVTATYPSCDPAVSHQVSDEVTVNLIDIATGPPINLSNACNPGATSYNWDFTSNGTSIMNNLDPTKYELSYHTSLESAQMTYADFITGSTTSYPAPGGTTIWVRVEDLIKGCVKVLSFDLNVNCPSTPVQPANMLVCDNDGNTTESFDLTQQDSSILGTQNQAADYIITYHTTLASADGTSLNSALIPAGNAVGQDQNFVSSGQTIYVRMESVASSGVFGTTSFQLVVNPRPAIGGTLSTCVGSTTQLTVAGASSSGSWSSSDTSVATVNSSGEVGGVAPGTAIITYTDSNGCFNTATVTVNPPSTPTFTQVATICSGGTLAALPTTSNEGITGTWSPALNNTATTNYTFTPDAGQCATTVPMTITVTPNVTPTFTQVAPICSGGTLTALPTISNEGITGSWAPPLNNTATTIYTFIPDPGPCAVSTTMTIVVTPNVTPTFTPVAPICSGATLSALPTTSNEGITGSWNPALNNTATTIYTFTPDAGQCSVQTAMTISVNQVVTPTFTQVATICAGTTLAALPTTSNEGITGSWSPALDNTATTIYTFTPDAGQCASTTPMTIAVNQLPTISGALSVCKGSVIRLTGSAAPAATNAWLSSDPTVATVNSAGDVLGVNPGTSDITYTNSNGCSTTVTVTVNALPTISGTLTTCIGATTTLSSTNPPAASNAWLSSDPTVATVNSTGDVLGVNVGTTT